MSSHRARRTVGRAARQALWRVPEPARTRIREVKRAALGQPSVAASRGSAARKSAAHRPVPPPTAQSAATGNPATAPADPVDAVLPSSPRLGTAPVPRVDGTSRLEVRRRNIFATADPQGTFLEIGPAHNGILARRDGYRTRNADYLDRAGLVEKYKGFQQYSMDDIEDVDHVFTPGVRMSEDITERFDLVLASHVIEHTTSLIDFVNECAKMLKPGGVLSLVVPDQRFTFDRFRQRSGLGAVIDASINPASVHTVGTLTEFSMLAAKHRGTTSWTPGHTGKYSLAHGMPTVLANAESANSGRYVDVHHWVLSPNHLRLLLHDLADLGYISLREAHFHDTVGHEFFLNLTADGTGPGVSRVQLIDLADEELRTLDRPTWEPDAAQPGRPG